MLYHPWSNQKENLDDKDCEQVFKFNFHTISKNIEEFSKIPDETIFRFMENADSRDNASRSNTDTDEEEINDEPADGNTINDFRSYLLFENMANFDNNRSSASSSSSTFTSTDGGSVARTIIS
ncbi:hypothetical protein HPULCUR_009466 [Helicostylum pulchrum]|uniref:Uncharacterized protein n=1 Tax=Helicostylum pulchrum TaxID=562976 RepID=A0ABP9YAI6_9FUNG